MAAARLTLTPPLIAAYSSSTSQLRHSSAFSSSGRAASVRNPIPLLTLPQARRWSVGAIGPLVTALPARTNSRGPKRASMAARASAAGSASAEGNDGSNATTRRVVEHLVYFQVKPNTSFSAVAAMVNGLRALIAPSSLASLSPFSPPGQPSTAPSATAAMVNCLRPHILFIPAHHFPFPLPPLHQVKPSTPSSAIAAMVNCLRPHIPLIPSPHYSPHPLLPSRQVKPNTPPSAVAAMVNGLRALSSAPGVLFLAVGSALPIPPALSASPAPPFTVLCIAVTTTASAASLSFLQSPHSLPPSLPVTPPQVKPNTPPSAVAAMVNGLRALSSAPGVLFLAVGSALPIPPALAAYTPQSPWTHALLGRYESRDALQAYAGSEEHVKVVEGCIKPIISDILAVDWETDVPADAAASASASAAADAGVSRLPFSVIHSVVMELGPSATANPTAIPTMVSSLKSHVGEIPGLHEVSIGENFAPARAKGFTWGYAGYHADEAALRVYAGDERHQQVMAEAVLPLVARYNWVDFRVDEVYEETSAKL
ncbi:unnamed protein product [Closterium sp. NIES-64]|nr:unnamed protein product [Closterium sp. NIES-64]